MNKMDPFSGTASAIAILQISGVIIAACYNYRASVKSATKDAKKIIQELNGLRMVIESLLAILEEEEGTKKAFVSVLEMLAQKYDPLLTCQVDLEELRQKLEPKEGWRQARSMILWPLKEPDVKKALQNIQGTKSTIQMALALDHRKALTDVKDNIQTLEQNVAATTTKALRRDIFHWLESPDSVSNHTAARKKCQVDTGLWLINGSQFQRWANTKNSSIWIYGIPGCGKTVLCSTIIDELQRHANNSPKTAIAFFYFDFKESDKTPAAFLKSNITQLAAQRPDLPPLLEDFYTKDQHAPSNIPREDLLLILRRLIEEFEQVGMVIDALDECPDIDDILEILEEINKWDLPQLHVAMASRPEPEIKSSLNAFVTHQIRMDQFNVDADIALYIEQTLRSDRKLAKWPPQIRKTIQTELESGSHGMFRWAVCQIETLRRCLTVKDVFKELQELPKTLEATYEKLLLRIPDIYRDKVFKLLQWLAFSARPTSIHEAAEMLAVDLDEERYNSDLRFLNAEDVMLLCNSLLAKGPSLDIEDPDEAIQLDEDDLTFDPSRQSWVVQLAHFSVKDYILSASIRSGKASFFAIDQALSDTAMVDTCLIYILRKAFMTGYCDRDKRAERFARAPLYYYATYYWPLHLRRLGNNVPDRTWKLLEKFFATRELPRRGNFGAWIVSLNPDIDFEQVEYSEPLYYAASFGLLSVVKRLCTLGADVDAPGGRFDATALHVAVYRGHTSVVRFLLEEMNAKPTSTNTEGESCLYWAVANDDYESRELLMKHGAADTSLGHSFIRFTVGSVGTSPGIDWH